MWRPVDLATHIWKYKELSITGFVAIVLILDIFPFHVLYPLLGLQAFTLFVLSLQVLLNGASLQPAPGRVILLSRVTLLGLPINLAPKPSQKLLTFSMKCTLPYAHLYFKPYTRYFIKKINLLIFGCTAQLLRSQLHDQGLNPGHSNDSAES